MQYLIHINFIIWYVNSLINKERIHKFSQWSISADHALNTCTTSQFLLFWPTILQWTSHLQSGSFSCGSMLSCLLSYSSPIYVLLSFLCIRAYLNFYRNKRGILKHHYMYFTQRISFHILLKSLFTRGGNWHF